MVAVHRLSTKVTTSSGRLLCSGGTEHQRKPSTSEAGLKTSVNRVERDVIGQFCAKSTSFEPQTIVPKV
ncbi:hypothetical protein BDM02DRAFT_3122438 [Thelephora ganbajun]|uniref:Uncharacterized protein n=1 Tax=Thelephora ganbajun TaxID=370292 RepID=A0ACB6Z3D3_THEGA|nr:hypothetical protein BDM02DRAFT_3122438 [Thelephora ganbajun]